MMFLDNKKGIYLCTYITGVTHMAFKSIEITFLGCISKLRALMFGEDSKHGRHNYGKKDLLFLKLRKAIYELDVQPQELKWLIFIKIFL
jgi:hypothetical protein